MRTIRGEAVVFGLLFEENVEGQLSQLLERIVGEVFGRITKQFQPLAHLFAQVHLGFRSIYERFKVFFLFVLL